MAKYCDSAKLERSWFEWLVADSTPKLEPWRDAGLLWTRVIGLVNGGRLDPLCDAREHCVLLPRLWFLATAAGVPDRDLPVGEPELPVDWHWSDQMINAVSLTEAGYYLDRPINVSWEAMISDIYRICQGIALKFKVTEDVSHELVSDSVAQVMTKIKQRKLVYVPGKAPVFNLLTTTIHRCMYSVLNRETKRRNNVSKLLANIPNINYPYRSLRVAHV